MELIFNKYSVYEFLFDNPLGSSFVIIKKYCTYLDESCKKLAILLNDLTRSLKRIWYSKILQNTKFLRCWMIFITYIFVPSTVVCTCQIKDILTTVLIYFKDLILKDHLQVFEFREDSLRVFSRIAHYVWQFHT